MPIIYIDADACPVKGEAEQTGVKGKAVTPFLLDFIRTHTSGRSLAANKALVLNNARLAAEIAMAYHRQK